MNGLAKIIGTVFGVGYLRPAPGTWGSAAALPLVYLFHVLGGFPMLLLATGASVILGVWAIAEMTRDKADHDPSEIVIDEVAGQFTSLLPLSYAAWAHDIPVLALWPGWVAAFLLFRLFDITKPGPIGWADRRNDPSGVMLDDIIAGIFAGIGVMILAGLWHGVLGL
ncbi:MAG: phosphatidylglycerophosphatase A [Rhodobacteraceae bacterium]|nr:phosphatidylglycerophosphatase A [Paracoccaceae bacterium]